MMNKKIISMLMVAAFILVSCYSPPTGTTTTTTEATTTTTEATTTTTTEAPSTTTSTTTTTSTPPLNEWPTLESTGPTVVNPPYVGSVAVRAGETRTISESVISGITVYPGGSLTLENVKITGWTYIMSRYGDGTTKFHMDNSSISGGMRVTTVDSSENLDWNHQVYGDVEVNDSWIRYPQGSGTQHTEALSSFGWPDGSVFNHTTFIQDGPFNGTATATINWHGVNTVFDNCYFGWQNGVAAWYTVYVAGSNNIVRNSSMESGRGSYIYPDSSPAATYINNIDAFTGSAI